ncbi:MAG: class I SAM-dependent methyltransferase [Chloroflexi bacterium]|nr:class I SAM-dependent methyltransferase [Chloroflexota bacterium]MDA1240187.1 class I SAM-dependent methyltransferase [Chloroflexota bacterium]
MPVDPSQQPYLDANLARWDESVPIHVASQGYDLEGFLRGEKSLYPLEIEEVGDVAGKTLLHLQCHFGMDTLNWARLGARVTGLDCSPAAVEAARDLAARIGVTDARFVQSDVYDAASVIDEQFDVVYTGIGAFNWLPDIRAWARVAAGFVRAGGFLYVYEAHPMWATLDDERTDQALVVTYPYFETAKPNEWTSPQSYVDGPPLTNQRTFEWNHGLGEVVTAMIDAGLRIEFVHEHRAQAWQGLPWMEAENAIPAGSMHRRREHWRLPEHQRDLVPLMYSIRASKPA